MAPQPENALMQARRATAGVRPLSFRVKGKPVARRTGGAKAIPIARSLAALPEKDGMPTEPCPGCRQKPIPGLFAIGNDAASIFGGSYPGAGATLGPAMTFGYICGKKLAEKRAAD